jgi:hypothetical protein
MLGMLAMHQLVLFYIKGLYFSQVLPRPQMAMSQLLHPGETPAFNGSQTPRLVADFNLLLCS